MNRLRRWGVSIVMALLASFPAHAQGPVHPPADLVVLNGRVFTVDHTRPRAEAIAVVGDRIRAVGTTTEMQVWIGPGTRVIDAHGKTGLPGFIDAHVHLIDGGADLSNVQLRDVFSREEFTRRIGDYARKLKKGEWIRGGNWDHEQFPGATMPTHEWIDAVAPDK